MKSPLRGAGKEEQCGWFERRIWKKDLKQHTMKFSQTEEAKIMLDDLLRF
jgi:hypothetical protein